MRRRAVTVLLAALASTSLLAGCALWCEMRGGSYERVLPTEERACVWPVQPAADAGEPCDDGSQCVEHCACSDEVEMASGDKHAAGELELGEVPQEVLPHSEGQCAAYRPGDAFTCLLVSGRAHLVQKDY